MKSEQHMEQIMNLTYPGLRLIHRDTNMRNLSGKYEVGTLIREERALYGSFIGGGLLANNRYAILSNRIEEAEPESYGSEWAMGVIPEGARFKVLDVYKRLGKAQIALLHLPDEHWDFFREVSTNLDDLLVQYVRKRFDDCLEEQPAEVLNDERWRKISMHLIGMTDLGMAFPLQGNSS